ncbi:MAG TPA: serine protease [Candidatus Bathyarchaeia archaeon]|nr:serine protease [Candidatus Bathyarchaeia archaeon]
MTAPRRLMIATGGLLCALAAVLVPWPGLRAQSLPAPEQRELAQARENAKWEQATAARRLDAFLRDEPGPTRCQIFVEWSPRLYAVAVSPDAEQHGARRGDRIKAIGEESVTTLADVKRIFGSMPPGITTVDVVVGRRARMAERESHEVPLSLACRSDHPRWEAKKAALEAMKDGRWTECAVLMQDVIQEWGTGLPADIEIRGLCAYYEARLKGRPIGPDDARSLYEWRRAQVAEARYDPGALDRIRGAVLTSANVLRAWNARNLAEDLESQIKETALRARNDPDEDTSHVQGTGVLARPDGTILTAAHVVNRAKHIVAHCPGRKEAVARVEAVARNLDLAIVKTELSSTAYLSLVPPRTTKVGEPLFTIGYPMSAVLGAEPRFAEGTVSALSGLGGESSLLQITVPVQPGNSGGPLVNTQGLLVGVVSAAIDDFPFLAATVAVPQNVNYAVKADYARPLFEQPVPRPAAASRTEAYERAKGATCRLEVDR